MDVFWKERLFRGDYGVSGPSPNLVDQLTAVIEDQYRDFLPVVSIAAEFVRYDLSYLPGFGIVCQFLACVGRRKIIGQTKEI
jgi:hypothetical protein